MTRDASFKAPKQIRAVRGPLTRARCQELGYACPEVFGDPAILLPDYIEPKSFEPGKVGLVPHINHKEETQRLFGGREDLCIIDVERSVPEVVDDIQSCAVLLSSSLHGIIVAHAFERPCAFVGFSSPLLGDGTKFDDYYLSTGVTEAPSSVRLTGEETLAELRAFATSAPNPDVGHLKEGLRESCPF